MCLNTGRGLVSLIADDHAIFAEVLRGYLEKTYTVVGVVLDSTPLWCRKPY